MWIISAIWIFLGFAIYGLLHSWTASNQLKQWIYQQFPGIKRYYRLLYSIFASISFLPILVLVAKLPDQFLYRIPSPWIYLTLLIQVVDLFVLFVGVRQTGSLEFLGLRQALSAQEDSDPLVVSGLYRYVRHPIYSLGMVLMLLFPVMTSNLLALFVSITFYILIGSIFEERKLILQYPEYSAYQQQVPMFVPKIR
jgi:methanethiol S-methyltransferase